MLNNDSRRVFTLRFSSYDGYGNVCGECFGDGSGDGFGLDLD